MNKNKIINNPTQKKLLEGLDSLKLLQEMDGNDPIIQTLFPNIDDIKSKIEKLAEQSSLLSLPDQFNYRFCSLGWIAYESMNVDEMEQATSIYDSEGVENAEEFLASTYDEKALKLGIMRFHGDPDFRKRIRLANLAKEDYLAERYHACIPLLLSIIDGVVNDVSKHIGLFAEGTNVSAWDSISGHESGLPCLAKLMSQNRNKTRDSKITIPYRNGIMHGRELNYDNKLVAAKCWAALFAARDWAMDIRDGKSSPKPTIEPTWGELINGLAEVKKKKEILKNWNPRSVEDIEHLPVSDHFSSLPIETPERFVAEFLDNWSKCRWGLVAESLLDYSNLPKGLKAKRVKEQFSHVSISSFSIVNIEDQTPCSSAISINVDIKFNEKPDTRCAIVRTLYLDKDNNPLVTGEDEGMWNISEHSISDIITSSES